MCPSRGRPDAARETLASFEATRRDKRSRILFIVDRDDPTYRDYPTEYTHIVQPTGCMGDALRHATTPAVLGDATSVGMIGDDNRFRTPGWDVTLDTYLTETVGVAYGDDGYQHERLPTSWWVSRPLVDMFGLAPTGLRHLYMDNWWKSLAEGLGVLRYFPDIDIEHLHPDAGKAESDATYRRGSSRTNATNDRAAFHRWERRTRPADLKRARALVRSNDKMRVLADWHHPALWESLAILFEDRFGWELYSMGGEGWLNEGWRLSSGPPIDWPATEYLSLDKAKLVGDHWQRKTPEYPTRIRRMVTPEQAFGMRWDYILGSVAEHQRPFSKIADRVGARFIHQVGNAKHQIDYSVPQVILASSSQPIRHRTPHVTYHQEFDRNLFRFTEPTDTLAVTSLMLRLDWTSCDYRWMAEAPGIRWSDVGGGGMQTPGYIAPASKIAARIAKAGWIWHDKRIGDGYGHVIHNAAAMGRPLIGHASHYKGLLGEPFWRDLQTCIDLDRHEPKEALRLIHAIAADPEWYGEMSRNIAAAFDEAVDFEAEAARIRQVLL
jgi:hypothetical protein